MVDFMDDKQLLGELKRGNNAAFEFLFKSYYPRLRGYAIRFIEDEETVRDIIQECFLRFWERREMLSAFSLTSLLFSINSWFPTYCIYNLSIRKFSLFFIH